MLFLLTYGKFKTQDFFVICHLSIQIQKYRTTGTRHTYSGYYLYMYVHQTQIWLLNVKAARVHCSDNKCKIKQVRFQSYTVVTCDIAAKNSIFWAQFGSVGRAGVPMYRSFVLAAVSPPLSLPVSCHITIYPVSKAIQRPKKTKIACSP